MSLRSYVIVLTLLLAAALLWRHWESETVQSIVRSKSSASSKPPKIQFDNGSVREYPVSPPNTANTPPPLGSLRKCQKGSEISYTNSLCPPGTREVKMANGTVSVVDSTKPPPAGNASKKPDGTAAAVDKDEPSIRDKMIDRAINR
jgi:hypothetical protein